MKNRFKLRSLSIAALIGLASMGMAQGATLDEVDLSQQPLNTPTLDHLGQNGVIYQKDAVADGVLDTPVDIDGDGVANDPLKSSYTLTETTDTTLDNVITKYVYDETNATLTEKHYQVNLKQTEYGTGDNAKHYKWTKDANGNYTFGETTQDQAQIVYQYSMSGYSTTATGSVTDLSVADVDDVLFQNLSSYNGAAIYNSADNSSVNITASFLNNVSRSYGGAIYNTGKIGDITGYFIENTGSQGAAIYNMGTIGNLTGGFIANISQGHEGGAIYNEGVLGDVVGDFVRNYTSYDGGAIYNKGTIGNINGDFIGNYGVFSSARGGAIYNYASSTIGDIIGDFVGNHANENGGAIQNIGTILGINGDFIGNSLTRINGQAEGGAISNDSYSSTARIGNITGDFIGNYIYGSGYAKGGAISNDSFNATANNSIGNIVGDFIGNRIYGGSSSAYGGAISNRGDSQTAVATIGDITGDFVGNYVSSSTTSSSNYVWGGAICNYANTQGATVTIGNITGDFIDNYAYSSNSAAGGAIYNGGKSAIIGNITGDFIRNFSGVRAGAIYNDATIGNITGDFLVNHSGGSGGAIYNGSRLGHIEGDFLGNYAKNNTASSVYGGAIYSSMTTSSIDGITGDFIGNYVEALSYASGGAIHNDNSVMGNITGNFINNHIIAETTKAQGGAIYNVNYTSNPNMTITDLKGDFIGNYAKSESGEVNGGAFHNNGKINSVTADFVNNYAESVTSKASGGALYNYGTIGTLSAGFVGNYAMSSSGNASGGAIYNYYGSFNSGITGDFISNYVISTSGTAYGGAIYNFPNPLSPLTGNFIGNYAKSETGEALGGAIYTAADITILADNKTIEFTGNYTESNGVKDDNAIYVDRSGVTITLNAKNNGVITFNDNINGYSGYTLALTGDNTGVINIHNTVSNARMTVSNIGKVDFADGQTRDYNLSSITSDAGVKYALDIDLTSKKSDKFITSSSSSGTVTIDELNILSGDWETLVSEGESKIQVLDIASGSLQLALGDNVDMPSEAILKTIQEVTSEDMTKDVQWNDTFETTTTTKDIYGTVGLGTTNTTNDSIAVNITEVQTNSVTTPDGDTLQLWNQFDTTEEKNFNFDSAEDVYTVTADLGTTKGTTLNINGVIAEDGTRSTIDFDTHSGLEMNDVTELNIKNVSLENSSALITNNNADSTINLTNTNIKNNTGAITTKGDVNITADGADVELSGNTGNAIYLDNLDKILTINLKNGGTVTQLDNIDGVTTYGVNIQGDDINTSTYNLQGQIANADLGLGNITLNTIDGTTTTYEPYSLTLNQDVNMTLDVDLANVTMDRFDADTYGQHTGNLTVTGMNLLSDSKDYTTEILFAEYGLKDNVKNNVNEIGNGVDNAYQGTVYSPIYKYTVSYDNKDDAGYFTFSRPAPGSSGSGSADSFNPAVLGSSSAATVGATATMNNAFNYSFQHSSDFMNIPYLERISMRDKNKYAISVTGDATDMGRFSPLYQPSQEEASVWVKPYATFETVGLKNGPKVHNNTYGTLIGFDTEMQSIKRGWDRVFTGYIGYNGASQRYSGIDSTQNGGLLGGTMTLYKGNFFNATTVSVGASVANNQTMYGNEDFAMLLSGIGNKTGYNFEFKEGKLILQPSMLMSYTFVNTFDYTNAAGVRIDNKPLHALQLAPGVKVIGNLKGGWQPYASVQMVWNLMGESNATANGVKLPEMSIKPYVQYGVGVQKRIKDHFTAYGQAMVQNGGRNGVSLTAGFRWALGHDNCKYKVEDKQLRGKATKSKCHSELDSESINANKTLTPTLSQGEGATSSKKILKQMTPEQKMAHGGKYYNTSRTAKTGSLRQY